MKGKKINWIGNLQKQINIKWKRCLSTFVSFCLSQHPKVRNVFNLDFPDSNHLAKTLTIVSGLDTVNLTYHNFFASKEKVTQVIKSCMSVLNWICVLLVLCISSFCLLSWSPVIAQTQPLAVTYYIISICLLSSKTPSAFFLVFIRLYDFMTSTSRFN